MWKSQQKFLRGWPAGLPAEKISPRFRYRGYVFQNVKTDLTAGNLLWMGMQALKIKNDSISSSPCPLGRWVRRRLDRVFVLFSRIIGDARSGQPVFRPIEEDITALDG